MGAAQGPVCPRLFFFFFHACQELARPAGTSGGTSQPSAGAVAGRTAEGFFLGGVPSFFRARQEAAWGASRRRVLRRSPFFFSVFASLAEAPALQAPEGGGVQLRQGAFFPLRFSFFFRSPGRTGRALSSPLRESAQPTSLESRVCPGVMEAYVRSPKLPPLVFEAQGSHREKPYVGVDVVRCRRNGLANAPFPLPILCPADGVEPVEPGRLPDLGYVEGCRDARQAALQLLPFVGPGWYPKVSIAAMLETGVCRWDHIPLGIYARGHVGAATLRRALERMDAAWPEGEEHMAKLSVNAMIGLWARRADVIYSVRSSVWDFVYTRRLLTNGTYRPIHDAVLGFERCMVAKARRLLAAPRST